MEKRTRTHINAMVTERALALISSNDFDFVGNSKDTKNVCAKLSIELSDRIDNLVSFLGVSKRLWLEAAILDALEQSRRILNDEGVHETMKAIAEAEEYKQEAAE